MDAPIGYRGLSDLLVALQDAVADKDARIATLEALLADFERDVTKGGKP